MFWIFAIVCILVIGVIVRHTPGGCITWLVIIALLLTWLIYAMSGVVPTNVLPWNR